MEFHKYLQWRQQKDCCGLEEPRLTFGSDACFSTGCWSTLRTELQIKTHHSHRQTPQATDPSRGHRLLCWTLMPERSDEQTSDLGSNIQIIVGFQSLPDLLCVLVLPFPSDLRPNNCQESQQG